MRYRNSIFQFDCQKLFKRADNATNDRHFSIRSRSKGKELLNGDKRPKIPKPNADNPLLRFRFPPLSFLPKASLFFRQGKLGHASFVFLSPFWFRLPSRNRRPIKLTRYNVLIYLFLSTRNHFHGIFLFLLSFVHGIE